MLTHEEEAVLIWAITKRAVGPVYRTVLMVGKYGDKRVSTNVFISDYKEGVKKLKNEAAFSH